MIRADAVHGHINLIVLAILEKDPSYSHEISPIISDRSGGHYVIEQTTLYTAVKQLEAQGALTSEQQVSESGKPRTYYHITPTDLGLLATKLTEWANTRALVNHFTHGKDAKPCRSSTPTSTLSSPPTPQPPLSPPPAVICMP